MAFLEHAQLVGNFCSCQAGGIFGKAVKHDLDPGENAAPDNFFPRSDLKSRK
jgi:hypothetical protein